jgi:DNA (cytosine-5)-methyltransferase 1
MKTDWIKGEVKLTLILEKQRNTIIDYKINRIASGKSLRTIDLFAGCGGLTLGFETAGFEMLGGIEMDEKAADSHALNFFKHLGPEEYKRHAQSRDITSTEPHAYINELNIKEDPRKAVDVLIGGPPCQAYSIAGRAKLREIKKDEDAFLNDKRSELYLYYIEYIEALNPLVILIENVPEIFRYGKRNIPAEIAESLESFGYSVRYTLLNSVFYGVPQLRDRMFLVAYAKELNIIPEFPKPTHHCCLPVGYKNFRKYVKSKHNGDGSCESRFFITPPDNKSYGTPAVTAKEAIGDLPPIRLHREGKLKRGARRFTELIPYLSNQEVSEYAQLMKSWPGFENNEGIYDHVMRYLPRDWDIFARMQENDEYPAAHRVALGLFEERLLSAKKKGIDVEMGTPHYDELLKKTVPPYDPAKFANKWRKMDSNAPVRTITAHIGKDSYSHIHYCSEERRVVSVREAARLQSFPDGFIFSGTLDPALRQIGNSVTPLLAKAVAEKIMNQLKET